MIKNVILCSICLLLIFACNKAEKPEKKDVAQVQEKSVYREKVDQFKKMEMNVDFGELTPSEREVLHKLGLVSQIMDRLYLKQVSTSNESVRKEIQEKGLAHTDELLELFDLHFGPWDTLDGNKPFFGQNEKPLRSPLQTVLSPSFLLIPFRF